MFSILLSVFLVLWLPFEVIGINSTQYEGNANVTIYGMPCQQWKKDIPHSHHHNNLAANFCRDPTSSNFLWCYTVDPNIRWGICDPRILLDVSLSITILVNNTESNCIEPTCCNMTWMTFEESNRICDPRIFVRILFNYYIPNTTPDMVRFAKKYVVATFFTIFQYSSVRSQLDCAYKCLEKNVCNGFTYSGTETGNPICGLGEFNTPFAVDTLLDYIPDEITPK